MTLRKPDRDPLPPCPKPPVDWVPIIQAIVVGIVAIMTAWTSMRVKSVSDSMERTEKKVDKVSVQTDGVVTAAKRTIAISAENLAVATKLPKDIKISEEAWQAYLEQDEMAKKAATKTQ